MNVIGAFVTIVVRVINTTMTCVLSIPDFIVTVSSTIIVSAFLPSPFVVPVVRPLTTTTTLVSDVFLVGISYHITI